MLSTIAMYALVAGTVSLAFVGAVFVITMRSSNSETRLLGWKKKALHPAPYLRFTGVSYGIAAVAFALSQIF